MYIVYLNTNTYIYISICTCTYTCVSVHHQCFYILSTCINIRSDFAKKYIIPEVEELSKDDEVEVRCVAMVTVAEMIPLVDDGKLHICKKFMSVVTNPLV